MTSDAGIMDHDTPCEELLFVRDTVRELANSHATMRANIQIIQGQIGEIHVNTGVAAENAKIAAREATAARHAADRTAARVYAPVDEVLCKYVSGPPLADAIDYGPDATEHTKTQSVSEIVSRAKRSEKEAVRLALEADRIEREGKLERERIERAAKIETDRIAEASRLRGEQLEREKRNAKLIHAAIGAIVTLAGVATTYLAARGH